MASTFGLQLQANQPACLRPAVRGPRLGSNPPLSVALEILQPRPGEDCPKEHLERRKTAWRSARRKAAKWGTAILPSGAPIEMPLCRRPILRQRKVGKTYGKRSAHHRPIVGHWCQLTSTFRSRSFNLDNGVSGILSRHKQGAVLDGRRTKTHSQTGNIGPLSALGKRPAYFRTAKHERPTSKKM
jgi:hypothetical protein